MVTDYWSTVTCITILSAVERSLLDIIIPSFIVKKKILTQETIQFQWSITRGGS